MPKLKLGVDVLTAARERVAFAFDNFERVCVSFSGGKDSTVLLHLAVEAARDRGRKVAVFFVDWECQFSLTVDHIADVLTKYAENVEVYWYAVPIRTVNGCSQFEPEWTAWDESKRSLWVREKHPMSISDPAVVPFWFPEITFEEFVVLFAKWFGQGGPSCNLVGIRAAESLNRFRAIAGTKDTLLGRRFTTRVVDDSWNVYPIYDWTAEDDWTYIGKHGLPYNQIYDRMHQAGLTLHQMRIDEPFGDTQRIGLWLYQIIEPKLWARMVVRVGGANSGALYANTRGNMMGVHSLSLREGQTWEGMANVLLDSMPPKTSEHYRNKIAKYLHWYRSRGYADGIPDAAPPELEKRRNLVPSWREVCRTLLRNDFWCSGLGFSATKTKAYARYLELMRRKRSEWGIYADQHAAGETVA